MTTQITVKSRTSGKEYSATQVEHKIFQLDGTPYEINIDVIGEKIWAYGIGGAQGNKFDVVEISEDYRNELLGRYKAAAKACAVSNRYFGPFEMDDEDNCN